MMDFLLRITQCSANYLIVYFFLEELFPKRWKLNSKINVFVIVLFAMQLAYVNSLSKPLLNAFLSLVITSVMVAVLFKTKWYNSLLSAFLMVTIIIGCEFTPLVVISIFLKADVFTVVNVTIQNIGFSFISTGTFFVIAIIAKFIINRYFLKKGRETTQINIFLILLPILSIVIIFFVFFISKIASLSQELLGTSVFIVLALVAVNIIVFASEIDFHKKHQYRARISEMDLQNKMQGDLIKEQNKHIKETNALVHDYKHQLVILKSLIKNCTTPESVQQTSVYIDQTLKSSPIVNLDMYSEINSEALRYILMHIYNDCAHAGIEFKTQIEFGDFEFYKGKQFMVYQDICTIFSNALENAFCACMELRDDNQPASISLVIKRNNRLVSILIRNDRKNDIVEQEGELRTTKNDNRRHGFGLTNMRNAAKNYDGSVEVEYPDNLFTISVLLTIKD